MQDSRLSPSSNNNTAEIYHRHKRYSEFNRKKGENALACSFNLWVIEE